MKQRKVIILLVLIFSLSIAVFLASSLDFTFTPSFYKNKQNSFQIKSIDTMKYSRDLAREKASDLLFDETIKNQVEAISKTGATHVAIGTPYDSEFIPFTRRWVKVARENKLNVYFRGNFSGWEGWFGYPRISRIEALNKLEDFILKNPDLFEDGDIFTPCSECENGSEGDPRETGDILGFREHLIDQYMISKLSFSRINKSVSANFFSMNGDVAKLIMDKETTDKLDGIVVVDHYVKSPKKLAEDIKSLAHSSGGKVVLGEFGAPISDIHGQMDEDEQMAWLDESLKELSQIPQLIGVNYWVCCGGSTQLWNESGEPRKAVKILENFYKN